MGDSDFAESDEATLLEHHGHGREEFDIEEYEHGHGLYKPAVPWSVLKLLYFLGGISASTWGRFGTIFYNEHGLSPYEIGTIEGVMTLVQAVAQPIWGVIADKYRQRKKVMMFTNAMSTSILMMLAVPAVSGSGFWGMASVSALMACFLSGSWLDSCTLDVLGERHKDKIGQFQLWGSLSWGLGALLMGFFTDLFGFTVNFTVYALLSFSAIAIMAWQIPAQTELEKSFKSEQVHMSTLLTSLARPRVLLFFFDMTVFGMGIAIVERLMFIFLLNDLKANTTLCGLTVGVTVLLELPIFHYSDVLLKRMSQDVMFMTAMLAYIIRVYGYTLLTPETVWWILPLELLHGITFAFSWVAGVKFMNSNCPPEWMSTAQSMLYTIYFCVGYGLGSVLGGYVMDRYGPRSLFLWAAMAVSALFVLHAVLVLVMKLQASHNIAQKLPLY